jgi:hypothetical protein
MASLHDDKDIYKQFYIPRSHDLGSQNCEGESVYVRMTFNILKKVWLKIKLYSDSLCYMKNYEM